MVIYHDLRHYRLHQKGGTAACVMAVAAISGKITSFMVLGHALNQVDHPVFSAVVEKLDIESNNGNPDRFAPMAPRSANIGPRVFL
jgi:uncharacterized protein YjhX (UPF0386 family)